MKRRLLIAAIFLLAGAVVNVAVAWGCALWIGEREATAECALVGGPADPTETGVLVVMWSRVGSDRVLWTQQGAPRADATKGELNQWVAMRRLREVSLGTATLPWWSTMGRGVVSPTGSGPMASVLVEDARGWPLRSLYSSFQLRHTPGITTSGIEGIRVHSASRPGHGWLKPRVLPFHPIWPGFAFNTMFYAGVSWLLIYGPFGLRRFIRVKRGLCPACAYPRAESDVCSECGKASRERANVTA